MGNLLPKDGIFGCRSISVSLWNGGSDGRGSATLHGETCCLENAGRLPASVYKGATMVQLALLITVAEDSILL
jgi:hypothetical protein